MIEVQVVEPATDVLVPLTRDAAERLDGRIRRLAKQAGDQLVQVGRLLDEAKSGLLHEALGFESWTAYVADAVGGQLQLSGEARQQMVQLMAGEGMSVRAIAAATGVSKSTVSNDLTQVSNDWTPQPDSGVQELDTSTGGVPADATVTGLDGKTYTKPKRKPRPKKEPKPDAKPAAAVPARRTPIRLVFRSKVEEMGQIYRTTDRLSLDPRWKTTTFAAKDLEKLEALIAGLTQLHAVASKAPSPTAQKAPAPADIDAVAEVQS